MIPRPPDSAPQPSSRPIILVLPIKQRTETKVPIPLEPARGLDLITEICLHEHSPGIGLPGPAQIRRIRRVHIAVVDRKAGVLLRVLSALGRDGDLLIGEWLPGVYFAALEDSLGVAEDEVDGAVYVTLTEELTERVSVESVLVALDAAAEEGRTVRVNPEGHGLVVLWAGSVAKSYVAGNEA